MLALGAAAVIAAKRGLFGSRSGVVQSVQPSRLPFDFSPSGYLRINTDIASAGIDPGEHYLRSGWKEGRKWR